MLIKTINLVWANEILRWIISKKDTHPSDDSTFHKMWKIPKLHTNGPVSNFGTNFCFCTSTSSVKSSIEISTDSATEYAWLSLITWRQLITKLAEHVYELSIYTYQQFIPMFLKRI